jgi:hypothetical protein
MLLVWICGGVFSNAHLYSDSQDARVLQLNEATQRRPIDELSQQSC